MLCCIPWKNKIMFYIPGVCFSKNSFSVMDHLNMNNNIDIVQYILDEIKYNCFYCDGSLVKSNSMSVNSSKNQGLHKNYGPFCVL